jgi:hypothetical protein
MTLPNAPDTLRRTDKLIAATTNPLHRKMLTLIRDHWWAEVNGDLEGIMRTVAPGPQVTQQYGASWRGAPSPKSYEETKKSYEDALAVGLTVGGPFEKERWAFSDWGLVLEALFTGIYPGKVLSGLNRDLDADKDYIVSWQMNIIFPIDTDKMLMQGEIAYRADPVSVVEAKPGDRAWLDQGPAAAA